MKWKKSEFVVAMVVTVVLIGAFFGFIKAPSVKLSVASLPEPYRIQPLSVSPVEPSEVVTGGGGGAIMPMPEGRVKEIRQGIVGELFKGEFEPVSMQLEEATRELDGFVHSTDYFYVNDLWHGELVSCVPVEQTTTFTFTVKQLIASHGKVISITTSTKDVTGTYSKEQIPYATVKVSLAEIAEEKVETPLHKIVAIAVPFLTSSFMWIGTALVVGVPLYFAFLGITILTTRAVIPITKKLGQFGKSSDD